LLCIFLCGGTVIFKLAALLLMGAFYAVYFGKSICQRKKGVVTMQLGSGKKGFVRFVECAVLFASILTPIAELICIFAGTTLFPAFIRWTGAALGTIGVFVFASAVLTMRDSWRAGVSETDKTELVTGGVFSVSRNPAFLGFDLLYIGILLLFFHPLLLIVTLFTICMFHLQIVIVEEPFLRKAFGEDYAGYANKVCRYLGRK